MSLFVAIVVGVVVALGAPHAFSAIQGTTAYVLGVLAGIITLLLIGGGDSDDEDYDVAA